MKSIRHFTHPYLLNPTHRVTISLCGAGGTGSHVLSNLAKVDHALRALGHPGFHVTVYDGDQISAANIGRQLYAESEIGENKAVSLVSRLNRFFGLRWQAIPYHLEEGRFDPEKDTTNFLITCVDTIAARLSVSELFYSTAKKQKDHPHRQQLYWMDFGNGKSTGQAVLGTCMLINQPKGNQYRTVRKLKNVLELYPALQHQEEEDLGPSCSTMEALERQDLFINATLATLGVDMLFRLFREGGLSHQGAFVNLPELQTNKIALTSKRK